MSYLLLGVYFLNNKNLLRSLHSIQNIWANYIICYSQQLTTGNELKLLNKLTANVKGGTIEVYSHYLAITMSSMKIGVVD